MDQIPESLNIKDIYPSESSSKQKKRADALVKKFKDIYGEEPGFIARSPGRVNLIGEHIDYSLYSVFPMALSDNDILIACLSKDSGGTSAEIHIANMDSNKFGKRTYNVEQTDSIDIDSTKHEWSNYFLSGFKGILKELQISKPYTMKCLVDGNVPSGAGVSSSSAFVCCSALATMKAHGKLLSKYSLTECCIKSERFVGVESGGMDQSCSVFGQNTSALLISFYPKLGVTPVKFPEPGSNSEEFCFVITHSMVVSDKHVTAPFCYNLRVVETRLAAVFLTKRLHDMGIIQCNEWDNVLALREVQELVAKSQNISSKSDSLQLKKMLEYVEEAFTDSSLRDSGHTFEDISKVLNISPQDLKTRYASQFPIKADSFQLYRRAKHVFSEALRVYQFKEICEASTALDSENSWKKLGQLMNESQVSCRDDFNCSCPELDELTELALDSGAIGSRLTGAGWGGCTVSLVKKSESRNFIEKIKKSYYKPKKLEPLIFVTSAGQGACFVDLDK